MASRDAGQGRVTDRSQPPMRVAVQSVLLLPVVALFTLLPFCLVWGVGELLRAQTYLLNPLVLLGWLLLLAPVHEGLHALGFLLGGVDRRALSFGVHFRTASVMIHCSAPMPVEAYRFASVLPFLAIGLLPAVLSWRLGAGWLVLGAAFSIASAVGDLLLLWNLRGVPAGALVVDHPERVGCLVLAQEVE